MRRPSEQARFEAIRACASLLESLPDRQREAVGEALLMLVYERKMPARGAIANVLAERVMCVLKACPMSPKEIGTLIGIDAETAVFKNALTQLRRIGVVEARGTKHNRIYRLTRSGK